jgi:Cu/Ag efflux protein CusF
MQNKLAQGTFGLALLSLVMFAITFAGVPAPAQAQSLPQVSGTVTKVDEGAEKITIRHGPIPNLDMGAMTMVFKAASPDMLKQVTAGDQITFTADRVTGQLTVTTLTKSK